VGKKVPHAERPDGNENAGLSGSRGFGGKSARFRSVNAMEGASFHG
jgi:hypothetical protein